MRLDNGRIITGKYRAIAMAGAGKFDGVSRIGAQPGFRSLHAAQLHHIIGASIPENRTDSHDWDGVNDTAVLSHAWRN